MPPYEYYESYGANMPHIYVSIENAIDFIRENCDEKEGVEMGFEAEEVKAVLSGTASAKLLEEFEFYYFSGPWMRITSEYAMYPEWTGGKLNMEQTVQAS